MTDFFARLTKVKTFSGPAAGLSITASSVASSEAFGSAQLNLQVAPTGIASAEAFGTAQLNQQVEPVGVASAEAYGTAQIQYDQTLTATGITSAEAVGAAAVAGPVTVDAGVASAEAFGTTSVGQLLTAAGVASAESFGTTQLNLEVLPAGAASAEAFGTASVEQLVEPASIASAEAFGSAQLNLQVEPTAIAGAEAFGTHEVQLDVVLQPSGVLSAEAFGSAQLNLQVLQAGAILSSEAFGDASLGSLVQPTGIGTAEAFGAATLGVEVQPTAIPSAEAHGAPTVTGPVTSQGIDSAEAFGAAQLNQQILQAGAIASEEAVGGPDLTVAQIAPDGVVSAEAFGTASLSSTLVPVGVVSEEAFGSAQLNLHVVPVAIVSGELFGTPSLAGDIQDAGGITSAEAFGDDIVAGPITVLAGITTAEAIGLHRITKFIDLEVFPTEAVVGTTTAVRLTGGALDMRACLPLMTAIDPGFWTDISAGSGATVVSADGYLLDTGTIANSVAGLRTIQAESNIDVAVTFGTDPAPVPQGLSATKAQLALVIDPTPGNETDFCLTMDKRADLPSTRVVALARVNGQVVLDRPVSDIVSGNRPVLRIMRTDTRVFVFVGSRLALTANWVTGAARAEVRNANDPTLGGRVRTTVVDYTRRAIVLFGNEPLVETIARSVVQVLGTVPDARRSGPVAITVYGCNGIVDIIPSAFTYVLSPDAIRVVNEPGRAFMTVVGDRIVRR